MKLADVVEYVVIDSRKLTSYALNPDSPRGKHKAILFERLLGFTRANYLGLMRQIERRCLGAEAIFDSEDNFGRRYTVDVDVDGAEGQRALVRTVWLVPAAETSTAHLITLYVKKR